MLDVTLAAMLAAALGAENVIDGVIYVSNRKVDPAAVNHPTVVGFEFLARIGAAVPIGGTRH